MKNAMAIAFILMCAAVTAAVLYEPAGAQLTPAEMRAEPQRLFRGPRCEPEQLGLVGRIRVGMLGFPKACYEQRINEYFNRD